VISERTEAMKVLLADLQADPELATRFLSEIRTLAALDHPNIAQLHTALQLGNELVMIMEFVEGMTLQQMAQQSPLSTKKVINYAHQVLAALSFAHSRGVVHRDIKPANVIVTPQGLVKLTDFGIAKSKAITELTQPGTTMGSLHYMSPEQAKGGRRVDGRCDLYSLGITIYELLAGCLPFADESAYVLLHNHLNDPPRPPIEVNPRLSKSLNDVILKALEKDPEKRFQDAASFSDALERASGIASTVPMDRSPLSGHPTPVTPGRRQGDVPRRVAATSKHLTVAERRFWVGAKASAGVVLLAGAAISYSHVGRATMMVKAAAFAKKETSSSIPSTQASFDKSGVKRAETVLADLAKAPPLETTTVETATLIDRLQVQKSVGSLPQLQRVSPTSLRKKVEADASSDTKAKRVADDSADPITTPARTPATTADLQVLRVQKVQLDSRASAVRVNVQRMKSQREAEGDGLAENVAGAYVRMNAYLSAENVDLEDGDLTAAREHMAKAAYEVNILETLFAGSVTAAKR
ncbi:MAG TPA: serine/threonine-protein kinase, partial [Acidobacteriaceae bacterium]|nr:serine/threonine-protein kinase [Acidobacteriaceae bacterium]